MFAFSLTVFLLALGRALLYGTGRCPDRFEGAPKRLSRWMAEVKDQTPLRTLAIPGAHDAATKGLPRPGETQHLTVAEQLRSGFRYFDLRVAKPALPTGSFRIFHSVMIGREAEGVLREIRDFLDENPSECVLLDFQHFKGSEDFLRERIGVLFGESGRLVENPGPDSDLEYLRRLTLGGARGKALVFWGRRQDESLGRFFLRNDNECTADGCCLDSYYNGRLHREGTEALFGQAHSLAFAKLREQAARGTDCFFVLQCQLTDKYTFRGPWTLERRHASAASAYIRGLREHPELGRLGIIMRDFVTPEKAEEILALNEAKGVMK